LYLGVRKFFHVSSIYVSTWKALALRHACSGDKSALPAVNKEIKLRNHKPPENSQEARHGGANLQAPATREAEVRGSLEPRSSRPAWAK
jgi:hypothetical protein